MMVGTNLSKRIEELTVYNDKLSRSDMGCPEPDINVIKFMLIDAQLEDRDREELKTSLSHINFASLLSGSAFGVGMTAMRITKGLIYFKAIRVFARSCLGVFGFVLGTHVGVRTGCDLTSLKFQRENRHSCYSAIRLILEHPTISKWSRFYNGDRSLMLELIPKESRPSLQTSTSDNHQSNETQILCQMNSILKNSDEVDSRFESGLLEYATYRRQNKSLRTAHENDLVTESLHSYGRQKMASNSFMQGTKATLGLIHIESLYRSFIDSYMIYLSNDYRRPFFY
ncbi:hypothetical protein V1511DRAFT_508548 [Dipodascopsis uninucleata]